MTHDTIVFDIETKNFFTDPEVGWNNYGALKISVACAYSYARDSYVCFGEDEMEAFGDLFRGAERIVGFGINHYDVPVLTYYLAKLSHPEEVDLWGKERVDLLSEITMATGNRISLSRLAAANLGVAKDRHGSEAVSLYREGRIDELKDYCKNDVALTKELYDLYVREGSFLIPDKKTGEMARVELRSVSRA